MKKPLIALIIYTLLLTGLAFYLVKNTIDLKNEVSTGLININELTDTKDSLNVVLTYNKTQLNAFVESDIKLKEELKKEKIKPPQIKWVLKTTTVYQTDSIIVEVGKPDSIGTYPLSFKNECLSFTGSLYTPSMKITIRNPKQVSENTYIGYLKKKKTGEKTWLIFNKKKKVMETHVTSNCEDSKILFIDVEKDK